MRRVGELWAGVVAFDALCCAARRAARGHRSSLAVATFLERLEPEVLQLQRELASGGWRPGPTHTFEIADPKRRTITAVPFRDRVVHHALMAQLEPVFERRLIADTFACRRGKGTHAALRRAQHFVRRQRFFLKLDVASFFPSIQHTIVRDTLGRLIKDRRVLDLCDTILAGPRGQDTVGLPIGSLTSQWFANMVLNRADHLVKERLRVPGYVRYMDDMALFADEKTVLHRAHEQLAEFLGDQLRLRLKARATRLAPVGEGLPFLGWRLFPSTTRLQASNARRYRWRLRHRRWQWERGVIDDHAYRQSVASVVAHISVGDTRRLRQVWFTDHDIPEL